MRSKFPINLKLGVSDKGGQREVKIKDRDLKLLLYSR